MTDSNYEGEFKLNDCNDHIDDNHGTGDKLVETLTNFL